VNPSETRQSGKILEDRHQADLGHGARGTLGLMSLSPPNTKSPFIFKACLVLVYYVNLTPTYPHDFDINSSVFFSFFNALHLSSELGIGI
jgi:hypothetical protein